MAASTDFNYDTLLSLSQAKIRKRSRLNFLGTRELTIDYEKITSATKEECVEYLEENRLTLTNPTINSKTLTGTWKCVAISYNEDRHSITQLFKIDSSMVDDVTERRTTGTIEKSYYWRIVDPSAITVPVSVVAGEIYAKTSNDNGDGTYDVVVTHQNAPTSVTGISTVETAEYSETVTTSINDTEQTQPAWEIGKITSVTNTPTDSGQFRTEVRTRTLKTAIPNTAYSSSKQAAPITDGNSQWVLNTGRNFRGSNNTIVLELRNVDPLYIETVMAENTEQTYTNAIYTADGGYLTGTWHNIDTKYEKNESTGMINVLWTVSKQANDDVHFSYRKDSGVFAAELFKFDAADTGIEAFKEDYWVDAAGNWYVADSATTYIQKNGVTVASTVFSGEPEYGQTLANLATDVAGRTVRFEMTRNPQTRFYIAHAMIEFSIIKTVWQNYLPTDKERVLDLNLVGLDEDTLNDFVGYYYFNDSGNWYYSTDGTNYTIANGASASGTLASVNAFNATQDDTNADFRRVSIATEQNPQTRLWLLRVRVTYFTGALVPEAPDGTIYATDTGNVTSFGTPNVTVTDTVVSGAAALPASAGTTEYNSAGTKLTETQIIRPTFDKKTDSFSYTQRVIESWAPHANQGTGAVGYVEGPSEIRRDVQSTVLAKGVGSGFAALGSWAGGGTARIAFVSNADGQGDATFGDTVQATKGFVPYNVTISRYSNVKTTSRMYFYVKEPVESEYPTYPTADKFGQLTESMGSTDLTTSVPQIESVQTIEDSQQIYGAGGDPDYVNNVAVYGKLALTTYDNGITTLAYWKENASLYGAGNSDNIIWHTLEVLRTYPATGALTITAVGNDAGDAEFTTSAAHGLSTGDSVIIRNTTNYDGHYSVTAVDTTTQIKVTPIDSVTALAYVANETGDIIRIDSSGINAGDDIDTSFDDGLYMGHYIQSDTSFYTEAIRHRIIKMAENVYALVVETIERTPWQWDDINKWMLNTEGYNMRFTSPATNPATLGGDVSTNVPFIM